MVITVIGLGFVGLTTSLGLASFGHTVFGAELSEERLRCIREGKIPFREPGLREILADLLGEKFFPTGSEGFASAVAKSDCIFFCVGTPQGKQGKADLTMLENAFQQVIPLTSADRETVLIVKSTVPPGTLQEKLIPFARTVMNRTDRTRVHFANNPEFLREGHCWEDFTQADRIVAGTDSPVAEEKIRKLYEPSQIPIHFVTPNTAEFIKYLSNSLLATMISFANETAMLGNAVGDIRIPEAFRILAEDKRWKKNLMKGYVYPGCGFGGYCLPKDVAALAARGKEAGAETPLLDAVLHVNSRVCAFHANLILEKLRETGSRSLGVLGLSFKPGSDDVRDSPAAKILAELLKREPDLTIAAYDPAANEEFVRRWDLHLVCCTSRQEVIRRSDVLAVLTAWEEFRHLDRETDKPIVDSRYCLLSDQEEQR